MRGDNPIASAIVDGRTHGYNVHSMFYTIQGEGPHAGRPALFVRFGGCNLRCKWCDTEFDVGTKRMTLRELVLAMELKARANKCFFIVLTGGEPMLQDLPTLINEMPPEFLFQIETAGTVWPRGLDTTVFRRRRVDVVVSPKTPSIHSMVMRYANAWKYIIRSGETSIVDGLPVEPTQVGLTSPAPLCRPPDRTLASIFVQPCDEGDEYKNDANLQEATRIALQYGYRLSLQMHKIIGVE